jgi:hypothetical protein
VISEFGEGGSVPLVKTALTPSRALSIKQKPKIQKPQKPKKLKPQQVSKKPFNPFADVRKEYNIDLDDDY